MKIKILHIIIGIYYLFTLFYFYNILNTNVLITLTNLFCTMLFIISWIPRFFDLFNIYLKSSIKSKINNLLNKEINL